MGKKIDKVIVTNVGALKAKYGSAGFKTIQSAVNRLIAADAKRGLSARLIALDDSATMKRLKGKPVTNPEYPMQNKDAIDAVFRDHRPDYLVILGAVDVVCHQDLTNPIKDDDDPTAFGDLPYACHAPYSKDVADFRGPTRVVGRIPDLTGGRDPHYLVGLLDTAANYAKSARAVYEPHLAISAQPWAKSTTLSVHRIFGSPDAVQQVPPRNDRWTQKWLGTRSHFINCHGGPNDPHFYGQHGKTYPIASAASYLAGRVTPGTVVAAECCYGAELYDPQKAKGVMGICSTYLAGGAYGFFGSSTTAYGPSSGNENADVICRHFFEQILAGASLGRAVLEARQYFVQKKAVLDPADLKTLAQFSLLGDPSIQPVETELPALTQTAAYRKALPDGERADRELRRERLARVGLALTTTTGVAVHRPSEQPRGKVRAALEAAARVSKVHVRAMHSYVARDPAKKLPGKSAALARSPSRFHVAVAELPKRNVPVVPLVLFVATEVDGKLVQLRRLHAR